MYPEYVLEKFLKDIDTCKSVDCFLIKLSSAIFSLEDYLKGNPYVEKTDEELVLDFLYNEDVQRVLADLADFKDLVLAKIHGDVRFRNLRKYDELLVEAITSASQKYNPRTSLFTVKRDALWRIEQEELHETPLSTSTLPTSRYEGEEEDYKIPVIYEPSRTSSTVYIERPRPRASRIRKGLKITGGGLSAVFGGAGILYSLYKGCVRILDFIENDNLAGLIAGIGFAILAYLFYELVKWGVGKLKG
ncbi:MAG: hypothetical protein J7L82_03545 [Staphylothermus sp.]|nr:hypothetical protein [Staphylothermus sp.]